MKITKDLLKSMGEGSGINADSIDNQLVRKAYVDSEVLISYDYVVDSQAKFNSLVSSGTWLGVVNVLFATNVTHTNQIVIPSTVQKIHGINGATITLVYNSSTVAYGIRYSSAPTSTDYEIMGLRVEMTNNGTGIAVGVRRCVNLINCTSITSGNIGSRAFEDCAYLTNCTGTGTTYGNGAAEGFRDCSYLINCTGLGSSGISGAGSGLFSCSYLINCTGSGYGAGTGNGAGFVSCSNLTNCTGTGVNGPGGGSGWGFFNCSYSSGCVRGNRQPSTAIWGGTTTKRDDDSCQI